MLETLRAVGFGDVVDQRSFQALVKRLAEGAHTSTDGVLIARPCQGCSLRLRLDAHGSVEGLEMELESAEQTISIHRIDETRGGILAHGFTCFDCQPVAPITVVASLAPAEFQPRKCYFARLSGILSQVELSNAHPGDMAFGQPDSTGALHMLGVLTASSRVKNEITSEWITLSELALPGLALAAITPPLEFEPGAMVRAEGRIHAVFSDPVP